MKTKSLKETVCVLYMTVCEVCVSDDVVYGLKKQAAVIHYKLKPNFEAMCIK